MLGGISSSLDHQVRPRSLAEALTRGLDRAGGDLRTGCAVAAITVEGDRVRGVELASGERVACGQVVVAAGWQSGSMAGLPARARVPVRPVKGQILRLRDLTGAPLLRRVARTPDVYLVPRTGGEMIVGATVEDRGPDATVTAGGVLELLRAAYEALPGVTELELVEAVAGLRPASPDNRPIVGAGTLEGLVWATAHWRNGVLLAPVTADAVAAIAAGDPAPERFAPFGPQRFDLSPGSAEIVTSGARA